MTIYYCPSCKAELPEPKHKRNPAGFYWETVCVECGNRIITDVLKNFDGLKSRVAGA